MSKVVLLKVKDIEKSLIECTALLGGIDEFVKKGDKVLIKPNLCTVKNYLTGATTDPALVENIIEILQSFTKDISIIESDHSAVDAQYAFEALGFKSIAEKYGIMTVNLSDKRMLVDVDIENGLYFKTIKVHKAILEADLIINVSILKTNEISTITVSLKNMIGILPDREKAKYHSNIDEVITDINKIIVNKKLIIVDGRIGMEGNGPISGTPVKNDILIMSDDPVAADYISAKVMGFDPDSIKYIGLSEKAGIGTSKNIEMLGIPLNSIIKPFKVPSKLDKKRKMRYFILKNKFMASVLSLFLSKIKFYSNLIWHNT